MVVEGVTIVRLYLVVWLAHAMVSLVVGVGSVAVAWAPSGKFRLAGGQVRTKVGLIVGQSYESVVGGGA